jgi:hypothetical protein
VYLHSLYLKNIYVYNNPSIALENIGMYILKGINVLMCRSSCMGIDTKFCFMSYKRYMSSVLRNLLPRFSNPLSREVMVLTLSRM